MRVKSSKRRRSTTVRPTRSARRSRRAMRSTIPARSSSTRRGERGPRPPARCEPIERRRRPTCHRPRVAVVGERVEVAPGGAAEHRHQADLVERGDLADGGMPRSVQLLGGDRADAPQPLDGQRVEEVEFAGPAATTSSPSGLPTPLATLARNLVRATPTVMARPTRSRTATSQAPGDVDRLAGDASQTADVEERLVDRRCPRPAAWCRRTPRTPPCWRRCRPGSAARRRSRRGTAPAPGARSSPCARRSAWPRSSPRARRRRRRARACRAARVDRAARPRRRTHRGRRAGSTPCRSPTVILLTNECSHHRWRRTRPAGTRTGRATLRTGPATEQEPGRIVAQMGGGDAAR